MRCKVFVLFLCCLLFVPDYAVAARRGRKIDPSSVFSVELPNGKSKQCYEKGSKIIPGKTKGKGSRVKFVSAKTLLKKTLRKINASALSSAKKKKKIRKARKANKQHTAACRAEGDSGSTRPYTTALTRADVNYLYQKAGFAPTTADLSFCVGRQAAACVDRLMTYNASTSNAVRRQASEYLDENPDDNSFADTKAVTERGLQQALLYILLNDPNQYHAKLAILFLHHHFAASYEIVSGDSSKRQLAWLYMEKLMNRAADGNYRQLVHDMFFDELQQIWLDGDKNTKDEPNENLGREFFELWTLSPTNMSGNPNYTEANDIVQVARAFTGFNVSRIDREGAPDDWTLIFQFGQFFPGMKTFFPGTPHAFSVEDAEDVIDQTLDRHPQAPVHLARRLASRYLTHDPSQRFVSALAKVVKQNNYNIHAAMRVLLSSRAFFAPENRNSLMKESTELMIGVMRLMEDRGFPVDFYDMQRRLESTGQKLGLPPTVFGWATDRWADSQEKLNMANAFVRQMRRDSSFSDNNFEYSDLIRLSTADALDENKVLTHLEDMFGVQLSPEYREQIIEYMNTRMTGSGIERERWDLTPSILRRKVPAIIQFIINSIDFQMK